MRNFNAENSLDFRLVKDRIQRATCLDRILISTARSDFALRSAQRTYLACKFMPRAHTFIGIIVDTCLLKIDRFKKGKDELCKINRIGRRTELIGNNLKGSKFSTLSPDRAYEVLAMAAVKPGSSDDHVAAS